MKTWSSREKRGLSPIVTLMLISVTSSVSATIITRAYGDAVTGDGSGTVTFQDVTTTQLTITFDNTSVAPLSSIITGLVFNVLQDIDAVTVASFQDSATVDLTSIWEIALNVDNNITPGNTKVDVSFKTTNGINGGIYNYNSFNNISNAYPDIATLVLNITNPSPWILTGVSGDILRMQRTGVNQNGSLKLPGYNPGDEPIPPIPAPAPLALIGLGGLLLGLSRRRQSR